MLVHAFLIKYAEIALKGKNRYRFEDALVHQMEIALSKIEGDFEVKKDKDGNWKLSSLSNEAIKKIQGMY